MHVALPAPVLEALRAARVPPESLSVLVQDVDATGPLLRWQADRPVNPASLMKLVTTYAALDLLGPAWTWNTPVWFTGPVREPGLNGVLDGDLVIKGTGDPKLVVERVWLMLRRVQQAGIREIAGDIVLDRTAFAAPDQPAGAFDGEALRAYNVRPDALLLNQRTITLRFVPDAAAGRATVSADPALAGVNLEPSVPLAAGACGDWQAALRPDFADPQRLQFGGALPLVCGERVWQFAYPDPDSYSARLLRALWTDLGGVLRGQVRDGKAPAGPASLEFASPPLGDVIRDINKFSNNPMAQQLFLTLGHVQRGEGSPAAARALLRDWLRGRLGAAATEGIVIDNGSGLSRETRLSAQQLAEVLLQAWRSPVMPELIASLPVAGLDGTLRRSRAPTGRSHLKTGSLRDVAGVAGLVDADGGRRLVLVAIVNDPNANAARPALDALVQWASGLAPASR